MARRGRRSDFGVIISEGTATHPAFSVRWREAGKSRRKRGFKTKTDAAKWLAKKRTELDDGTAAAERRAQALFVDVGEEWLRLHSAQLRSHSSNQLRWRRRVVPFFAGLSLARVTTTKILEFKRQLQSEDVSDATRNQYLQLVRAVCRYAVATGYLPVAPTDRIRKLLIPIHREKLVPPIARPEDVGRYLEAVAEIALEYERPSYTALFATAVYTGLRRGELCGLRWSDISLDERVMVVRKSYSGPTKSGKDRVVPLPTPLLPILKAWKLRSGPKPTDLVFPNDRTGEMYTRDSAARLRYAGHEACKRAGLGRIRFHDLRHYPGRRIIPDEYLAGALLRRARLGQSSG